jgi:hypothetical protein
LKNRPRSRRPRRASAARVLAVRIHEHHGVAHRGVEAGGQRRLLAEVAAEADQLDPGPAIGQGGDDPGAAVPAAVIDIDHLDRQAVGGIEPGGQGLELPVQRRDRIRLVVQRHDDREAARTGRKGVVHGALMGQGR